MEFIHNKQLHVFNKKKFFSRNQQLETINKRHKMSNSPDFASYLSADTTILPEISASLVATVVAIGGLIFGASYLVRSSTRYSGAPPGPARVPLIGNLELIPKDITEINDRLQELVRKYGPIFCMYKGNK